MKQITVLFITFSGIYAGYPQKPAENGIEIVSVKPGLKNTGTRDSILPKEKVLVKLFPNPAKNKVEIILNGFEAGFMQVQIFDACGKKRRNDQRMLYSGYESIQVMFSLEPGLYFISLNQKGRSVKRRLLVE